MRVPRLTANIAVDLLIWMVGLGIAVGAVYPLVAVTLGVAPDQAMTVRFALGSIVVEAVLGIVAFAFTRTLVGSWLAELGHRMREVQQEVVMVAASGAPPSRISAAARVPVDAGGGLGGASSAFNAVVDELGRARRVELALREFSESVATQVRVDALATEALRSLLTYVEADGGALLVLDSRVLELKARYGLRGAEGLLAAPSIHRVLGTARPRWVDQAPEGLSVHSGEGWVPARQLLVAPVPFMDSVLGVLVVAANSQLDPSTEQVVDLFCKLLGVALKNAIGQAQMEQMAVLDALTLCYNRHFGLARLDEELARSRRTGIPFGLLILDLDGLKDVNDTWGHWAGDEVLAAVGRAFRQALRQEDILVRMGGEEFLAILPGAGIQHVEAIGERLRRSAATISVERAPELRITASGGGTAYPTDYQDTVQDLLRQAEGALDHAKSAGKDRLVLYCPRTLPVSGDSALKPA
ncbi:MAG: diguanylate cyclase [Chloroflexi bacterium]|nr:diguanylate cyclase [Chloroflexota bacterium]